MDTHGIAGIGIISNEVPAAVLVVVEEDKPRPTL